MIRRITVSVCALMVLVLAATSGNASAAPVQTFATSGGDEVDWTTCFGGAAPASVLACGAGSSATAAPANTPLDAWQIVRVPAGSRLIHSLLVYSPHGAGQWQETTPGCAPVDGNNDCTAADVTGDYTAGIDLLCSGGSTDIVASPSSSPGTWPGASWIGYVLTRSAAGGTGEPFPGSPNGYVPAVRPQPPTFGFVSLDSTGITHVWLAGAALFPLPAARPYHWATYESNYVSGLRVSSNITADPTTPPTDDYLCEDGPQHSNTKIDYLTTPAAAGLYPRWALMQSAPDIRDGSTSRIFDTQCVAVGGGAPDADGDCLSDAADGNDANPDQDGDLLPDGVEVAAGSSVTSADADGDGAHDYAELAEMTDPAVADTDGDGSLDKLDNGADEVTVASTSVIDDTTADDNCPTDANAAQTNTDFGPSISGPTPPIDRTNPDQDAMGDACDLDDDNDGMTDIAEASATIVPWSGNTDPGGADLPDTTVCKGAGVGAAPAVPLSPTDLDSDDDGYLDGLECQMAARPDIADLAIASCTTAPVDADGCGRIERAGVTDPDADKLYHPTSAAGHAGVEAFFRTRSINLDAATQTHDADEDTTDGSADADADNDTLSDGIEVWSYGTNPSNIDTDGDACTDGMEAADLNGNRVVNAQDHLFFFTHYLGGSSYRAADGTITALAYKKNADQNRNFIVNAQDSGLMQVHQVVGIALCNPIGTPHQKGIVITNQSK
jgi:hypothetical protein